MRFVITVGLLAASLRVSDALDAERIVYPPEAIDDAMHLKADDFRALNPGIDITLGGLTDEGFYVRYVDENLIYYFGPISDLNTARHWRDEMLTIRDALIQKRPELAESQVELVRFSMGRVRGGLAGDDMRDVNGDGVVDQADDVNGDGVIDEMDGRAFRAAGRDTDVNGDGVVDARDDINGDGKIDGDDVREYNRARRGAVDVASTVRDDTGNAGQAGATSAPSDASVGSKGDDSSARAGTDSSEAGSTRIRLDGAAGATGTATSSNRTMVGSAGAPQSSAQNDSSPSSASESPGQPGSSDASGPPVSGRSSGGMSLWQLLMRALFGR